MSTIDQFESIFRAAARESYAPRPFPMREVMLIADLRFKEEMSILLNVFGKRYVFDYFTSLSICQI